MHNTLSMLIPIELTSSPKNLIHYIIIMHTTVLAIHTCTIHAVLPNLDSMLEIPLSCSLGMRTYSRDAALSHLPSVLMLLPSTFIAAAVVAASAWKLCPENWPVLVKSNACESCPDSFNKVRMGKW